MINCDHSDLLDFDCEHPCPACGESGPHHFGDEPYCDMCGKPHEGWFDQIKHMVGAK